MAGANLLTLLDDIATLLDDVAVMTKLAAKKTAGVLGDDLALNAEQVTGVAAERELPVVWAVAKGSALNKVVLIPAALAISAFLPPLVIVLLMLGGAFLCFEGFEKALHKLRPHAAEHEDGAPDGPADPAAFEKQRIRGAIRTDFILSAEIIVIVLGVVASEPFVERVLVLCAMGMLMTVGVYGLVAGIVKLDDAGLALLRRDASWQQTLGRAILTAAPRLMKLLGIAGTVAMFLVGGGIFVHNIGPLHHLVEPVTHGPAGGLVSTLANGLVGVVVGGLVFALVEAVRRVRAGR